MRSSIDFSIWLIATGRDVDVRPVTPVIDFDGLDAGTRSSTIVFHSPHEGQRPIHFDDSAPQLLQNHAVFTCFAIVSVEKLKQSRP